MNKYFLASYPQGENSNKVIFTLTRYYGDYAKFENIDNSIFAITDISLSEHARNGLVNFCYGIRCTIESLDNYK